MPGQVHAVVCVILRRRPAEMVERFVRLNREQLWLSAIVAWLWKSGRSVDRCPVPCRISPPAHHWPRVLADKTSLMWLVHPTLTPTEIACTAAVVGQVLRQASVG